MTKPKVCIVAMAALAAIALLSIKVAGQAEGLNDGSATAEPAAGTTQFAGELPKPQTQLESIALQTGSVITKGYSRIGEVPGDDGSVVRISAVQVAVGQGPAFRGLLVQVQQNRGAARSAVSYIDEDELDNLIAAVQSLSKLQPDNNRLTDVDSSFRSKGDLEVINANTNGTRLAGVRCTQLLRPTGQIVWATASFGVNRLDQLQHQLEAGKQALEGLKNPEK